MRERNRLIIRGLERDIGGYVFGEREREREREIRGEGFNKRGRGRGILGVRCLER